MNNDKDTNKVHPEMKEIIFDILESNPHNWIRYWRTDKKSVKDFDQGEYIEIRARFIMDTSRLNKLLEMGFKIKRVDNEIVNNDAYSRIMLVRDIALANQPF